MDNSSRNIVKFIAAITGAALLMMGARYYAESQKAPKPPEVAEKAATPEAPPAGITDEVVANPETDAQNPAEDVIEEDAEITMGEPSMNLEQGGTPAYAQPAQSEPSAEPQPEQ